MSIKKKYISNESVINAYQKRGTPGVKELLINQDVLISEQGIANDVIDLLDEPIPYMTKEEKWRKISIMISARL